MACLSVVIQNAKPSGLESLQWDDLILHAVCKSTPSDLHAITPSKQGVAAPSSFLVVTISTATLIKADTSDLATDQKKKRRPDLLLYLFKTRAHNPWTLTRTTKQICQPQRLEPHAARSLLLSSIALPVPATEENSTPASWPKLMTPARCTRLTHSLCGTNKQHRCGPPIRCITPHHALCWVLPRQQTLYHLRLATKPPRQRLRPRTSAALHRTAHLPPPLSGQADSMLGPLLQIIMP